MKDSEIYPDPERFDPEKHKTTGRAATDMGREWPFWGNSKLAWYVSRMHSRVHLANTPVFIALEDST